MVFEIYGFFQWTDNPFSFLMSVLAIIIILYYIFLHYIVSYIISYHIISYHIISYHIISYHIISYHIISYHIIWRVCIASVVDELHVIVAVHCSSKPKCKDRNVTQLCGGHGHYRSHMYRPGIAHGLPRRLKSTVLTFRRLRKIAKICILLASSRLSIRQSAWNNSAPTERIFMRFDI